MVGTPPALRLPTVCIQLIAGFSYKAEVENIADSDVALDLGSFFHIVYDYLESFLLRDGI